MFFLVTTLPSIPTSTGRKKGSGIVVAGSLCSAYWLLRGHIVSGKWWRGPLGSFMISMLFKVQSLVGICLYENVVQDIISSWCHCTCQQFESIMQRHLLLVNYSSVKLFFQDYAKIHEADEDTRLQGQECVRRSSTNDSAADWTAPSAVHSLCHAGACVAPHEMLLAYFENLEFDPESEATQPVGG